MQDVADLAGVSVATVSRALRGSSLVNDATRERVLAAAEDLSFSVSRAASSLATGKLNKIAVLVSGRLNSWFNGSVLDAMYEYLHAARQELIIYRILDDAQRIEFFATLPARRNADALVVASFALTTAERRRLRNQAIPLIYLNQRVRGAVSVAIDDLEAARTGARHLIELGHRRIGFVTTAQLTGLTPPVGVEFRVSGEQSLIGHEDHPPRSSRPETKRALNNPVTALAIKGMRPVPTTSISRARSASYPDHSLVTALADGSQSRDAR